MCCSYRHVFDDVFPKLAQNTIAPCAAHLKHCGVPTLPSSGYISMRMVFINKLFRVECLVKVFESLGQIT